MHKIAVLDYRLLPEVQDKIQELASNKIEFPKMRLPRDDQTKKTGDADIVLISPWDIIDTSYLDACPNLKYIGLCGTSTANIDLDALFRRNISFSNIVSSNKEPVAEFFFMQLVALIRGAGDNQWKKGETHELAGIPIGIIGLGAIGKAVARIALAYKMQVYYFSPNRKSDWEDLGVSYLDKNDLLKQSAVTVLCSPSNVEVLNNSEFELIQPGSILIQACGGSPFSKDGFKNWVSSDNNYAIFDMSANENNYKLFKDIPRVIFSRDVAGDTYESNQRRGSRVLENLHHFLKHIQ
ncbi:MAG: NAD(P)-dependent oxidoreductase [Candidatus Saccharimonadales bacterium]